VGRAVAVYLPLRRTGRRSVSGLMVGTKFLLIFDFKPMKPRDHMHALETSLVRVPPLAAVAHRRWHPAGT
jgi:hypothetical protein